MRRYRNPYFPIGVLCPLFAGEFSKFVVLDLDYKICLHATSRSSYTLFKFLAFPTAIFVEFFEILYALSRCTERSFLTFLSLKEVTSVQIS